MPIPFLRLFSALALSAVTIVYAADKTKTTSASPSANPYAEVQPANESLDINMYQRIRD